MGEYTELIWLLCPLSGILSIIGGWKKKSVRRIGIPCLVTITALVFCGWSWYLPLLWVSIFAFTTLPFTLIGDSIPENWINWLWVVVYSALMPLTGIFSALAYGNLTLFLWACLVAYIVILPCFILSNVKATARLFTWKFVEGLTYMMMVYPICQVLTNS